ncbi:hypothetical protein [Aquamicrobium terrae]|uniref:Flagellar basal body-associated protein FliL n=1 Tax=Aquamicrobium terrae TaxID=1324945 RepID=A0ABV2N2V2_9HYPH
MARIFPEQKAKQGRSGWRVLVILICGVVLALVAWGVAELVVPGDEAPTPTQTETAPAAQ